MPLIPRLFRRSKAAQFPLRWVTDNIAVSRAPADDEWAAVFGAGVTSVLCVRGEGEDACDVAMAAGLAYRKVDIEDHLALPVQDLGELAGWIEQQVRSHQTVLVHCREGRGRSPMVACAALLSLGYPLPTAFELVRRAQPALVLSDEQVAALEALAGSIAPASEGSSEIS